VVSVIPGTMSLAEQQANIAAINKPIPTDFWKDLKVEDLLRADAPVPE
jgi:D-threo-aldose 1-dehydrogenase